MAYVERVVSANEIIVSQDSWGGDFSWARITRTSSGWPSGFVHFNDVRLVNTVAPTIKGIAKVGSALTASPGTWSRSGLVFTYQWLQNGAAIAGATGPSLTPKLAQRGKRITVRVTASSLGFATTSVVSAATAAVQAGVIENAATPTITGEPRVDSVLTATSGTWSPAPDLLTYQWKAAGVPIQGATQPTLTVDPSLVGKPLAVTVTAARTGYADVSATSTRTAPVSAGQLTVLAQPTVKGSARPGQVLTIGQPGVRPEPARAIEWLRGGKVVKGATGPRYRLTAADLGSRVGVRVRLTRPGYDTLTTRTTLDSGRAIETGDQGDRAARHRPARSHCEGHRQRRPLARRGDPGAVARQAAQADRAPRRRRQGHGHRPATRDPDLPLPGAGHDQGVVRRGGAQDQDRLSACNWCRSRSAGTRELRE